MVVVGRISIWLLAGVLGAAAIIGPTQAADSVIENGWIVGRVVGPDLMPIDGLLIDPWGADYSPGTRTLDSGEFSIELEPGTYTLWVWDERDESSAGSYRLGAWPTDGCSQSSSARRSFVVVAGETIDAGEWRLQPSLDPAPVPPVPTGRPPDDWLGALNWYRAWSRLPSVTADPCGNASQLLHIEYLKNSGAYMTGDYVSAHSENPESPWYTPEGARAAIGNIGWLDERSAIENWMRAPYHGMYLLKPGVTVVSFAYAGRGMLQYRAGYDPDSWDTDPSPILFPGSGSTIALNNHTGEIPSPIDSCPGWTGSSAQFGLPLFVMDLTNPVDAATEATLQLPSGEVVTGPSDRLCVLTQHNDVSGHTQARDVIVIYDSVLPDGDYSATVTNSGSPAVEWTFTIDAVTNYWNGTFVDDDDSVFQADIEWLAAEGITKGCNPPANDRYCPDTAVTRGQMAAFLVRALGLSGQLDDPFTDDDVSIFESDIEKLAGEGITKGCNPPANDRFCPDAKVTRGQMAAFLVRALGYTDNAGGDLFIDDDDSIFEADIDRLGTAGVTKGCNPPKNDEFCASGYVTRGQMAAFLQRALG